MNNSIPAGFWRRLAAHIIDWIVLLIPYWLIEHSLSGVHAGHIDYAIDIAYTALFLSSTWQATPGKRMLNVYIVSAQTGHRISMLRAFARAIAFYLPVLLMFVMPQPNINDTNLTTEEKTRLAALSEKIRFSNDLSAEENQSLINLALLQTTPLTEDEKQGLAPLRAKMARHETLMPDENKIFTNISLKHMFDGTHLLLMLIGLGSMIYWVFIVFTVALTQHKTGIHDMICKTRALRGRPGGYGA